MNMEFNQWYRSKIESFQEDPPEKLWDDIQDDLDLKMVWQRIDSGLSGKQKSSFLPWKIAASVAFLLGLGTWFYFSQSQLPQEHMVIHPVPENWETADLVSDSSGTYRMIPRGMARRRGYEPSLGPEESSAIVGYSTSKEIHSMKMIPAEKLTVSKAAITIPSQTRVNRASSSMLGLLENANFPTRISLGVIGQYANTWQLNGKTFQGMRSHTLTHTQATFGNNYGLAASFQVSAETMIRADLILSQSRQNYQEYVSGRFSNTGLDLDYIMLSVMGGRRLGANHSRHWLNTGFYFSNLIQAHQKTNETITGVKEEYSKTDLGLILGYEYQLPLIDRMYLGTGIYARYGLRNVFEGNQNIPGYLNRTKNAAFIFSLSVNYSLN